MEPVLIKPDSSILNEQYQFMIQREFYVRYGFYKKIGYYFLAWLAVLAVFSIFTDTEKWVTLKVILLVLSTLAIIATIVFLIIILLTWVKRQTWKKERIKYVVENNIKYWLTFDENQITFSTESYNTSIKWAYYRYYKVQKDSIYILPDSIYESIACSKSEIGQENYDRLKEIIEKKLTLLD